MNKRISNRILAVVAAVVLALNVAAPEASAAVVGGMGHLCKKGQRVAVFSKTVGQSVSSVWRNGQHSRIWGYVSASQPYRTFISPVHGIETWEVYGRTSASGYVYCWNPAH